MSIELHLVSRWEPGRVMPHLGEIRDMLEKFAETWPGDETYESLCKTIDDGYHQLWVFFENGKAGFLMLGRFRVSMVTGRKTYEIKMGAGEFRFREIDRIRDIERYAAKRGAVEIETTTLPGIRRALSERGYKTVFETVRKPLIAEGVHGQI